MSVRCAYCGRTYCSCDADEAIENERLHREELSREEAAYVASCVAHGIEPYSSRDLSADEASQRLEELEQARRDLMED